MSTNSLVRKLPITLRPDARRVLIRPFRPGTEPMGNGSGRADEPRVLKILSRIFALSEEEAETQWKVISEDFAGRHEELNNYFLARFDEISSWLPTDAVLTETRRLLIGSYFTHEYSLEAAALFNPSIVACPDQSGLPEGSLRFILSLRAVGEGHISSLGFRSGIVTENFDVDFTEAARWVVEPKRVVDESFNSAWFHRKCRELGVDCSYVDQVVTLLPEHFNEAELKAAVRQACAMSSDVNCAASGERLLMLAKSNFSVAFDADLRYSERAIFPVSPSQTNGIEDARFVQFTDDDGTVSFYATYTAFDGRVIFPQILETNDFLNFHFRTLQGAAVQNKGMALFPRRIDGRFAMLSRQDNENIRLMYSDDVYRWDSSEVLVRPTQPWEFVQLGNCGSPLEIDDGWLLLTHGVGAMRKYCIGALLLDKNDPSKVIGRLTEPLIRPAPEEREGYVPNVVYTCGGLIHKDHLVLPYATSDWFTSFGIIKVPDLVAAMK
ncbi:MAG TPA: glycoside hydrolase family 130 protein [Verrucomicrobiales bacterium]|nr:glycoside hydrolase family 130 protein [Verrucomicrobiales bacterium]